MTAFFETGGEAAGSVGIAEEPSAERVVAETRSRVLVVDDSRLERGVVGRLVEQNPRLEAVLAAGGREALQCIAEDPPAVILTDFVMPEMDGLQLVEAVRADFPEIPVVLMTAHGDEETALRALRAGAASYVPKHALQRDLQEVLRQVLLVATTQLRRRHLVRCMTGWEADFVLDNDPQWHEPLVDLLQEQFRSMQLGDSSTCMQVGIALVEALANALYHGNLEVSSELRQEDERAFHDLANRRRGEDSYRSRRIRVHAEFNSSGAVYRIRDDGSGFDTSILDRPVDPADLLRIGGRGLLLIRSFMDEVRYNATGNELTMVKKASTHATA